MQGADGSMAHLHAESLDRIINHKDIRCSKLYMHTTFLHVHQMLSNSCQLSIVKFVEIIILFSEWIVWLNKSICTLKKKAWNIRNTHQNSRI